MALPFQTPPINPLGGGPQGGFGGARSPQFIPQRTEGGQTPPFDPRMQRQQFGGPQGGFGTQQTQIPPGVQTMQPQQVQPQFEMMGGQKTPILNAQPQAQQQFQQAVPQTGLIGAEQALQGGLQGALGAQQQGTGQALNTLLFGNQLAQGQLQAGQQALGGDFSGQVVNVDPNTGQPLFQQAAAGVGAFSPAGLQAQGIQAALSGTQGQEAFNQAFIDSPVQAFLRQQGEESIANQAAASGGLGSGQFQKELAQFGQGLAGTQLQQQIQNQAALSGQGLQAAGQQGQFLSQAGQQQGNLAAQNAQLGTQANLANAGRALQAAQGQAGLFGQGAGISAGLAGQGAGFQQQGGLNAANLFSGTGQQVAQGRTRAGEQIAGQVGASTSALANLANQQGTGLSDILGGGAINQANLQSQFGQLSAAQQQQLMAQLANLSTGQATQLAGGAGQIGQAQAGGILGQAGAIGGTVGDIATGLGGFFGP